MYKIICRVCGILALNLYSGLGCPRVRAPKGLNLTAQRAVEATYPELDRLYSCHIISIIEHSSIMKNNPARIEVKHRTSLCCNTFLFRTYTRKIHITIILYITLAKKKRIFR